MNRLIEYDGGVKTVSEELKQQILLKAQFVSPTNTCDSHQLLPSASQLDTDKQSQELQLQESQASQESPELLEPQSKSQEQQTEQIKSTNTIQNVILKSKRAIAQSSTGTVVELDNKRIRTEPVKSVSKTFPELSEDVNRVLRKRSARIARRSIVGSDSETLSGEKVTPFLHIKNISSSMDQAQLEKFKLILSNFGQLKSCHVQLSQGSCFSSFLSHEASEVCAKSSFNSSFFALFDTL